MSRTQNLRIRLLSFIMLLLSAGWLPGQTGSQRLEVDFGYRGKTDLAGSEALYRSHLNYGEGPKLFSLDYGMTPSAPSRFFDRLDFGMDNWGGEPYNNAYLRLSKRDLYDLRFTYRNAQYFSSVPFYANPLFEQGSLLSQHRADSSQRSMRLDLELRPGKRVSPFFSYQRITRLGLTATTLRADGDEFTLHSDLDVSSDELRGGVNLSFSKVSLLLEQSFRWHRDQTPFFSGAQAGNSTRTLAGRDIFLNRYQGENDFDVRIPVSTAAVVYYPFPSLHLRGQVSYSMADLDSSFSEELSGAFLAFSPIPVSYPEGSVTVTGGSKEPNLTGDFSVQWKALDHLQIVERVRIRRRHVSGSSLASSVYLNAIPLLGPRPVDRLEASAFLGRFLGLDQTTQELRGLVQVTPRLLVSLGHRWDSKELELDQTLSWDRHVLLAGFSFEISGGNRLALDYELGRTDQPLIRTDPVDFHRLHVRGQASPFDALQLSASVQLFDHEDDLAAVDFTSRSRDYSFQFNYAPHQRVSVTGEYERSSVNTDILFAIPLTLLNERSIYREKGHFSNVFVTLLLLRNTTLSLGYSAWSTAGSFPVNSHRPMLRYEVPLTEHLVAYGQWNYYGYNEKLLPFPQDYRTHLFVAGMRVNWER